MKQGDSMNPGPKYRTVGGCDAEIPDPCGVVIFGASGDLSKRRLIPALYRLHKNRLLPENFFILGTGRTKMSVDRFREAMLVPVTEAAKKDFDYSSWTAFAANLYYLSVDYTLQEAYSIFEPLWNNKYIDHVQITVSETIGVGHRAGYYEEAGVIRDMFPNHLLQLPAITAMEAPPLFEAEMVRDEKTKVFRSIRPIPLDRVDESVVIGQYGGPHEVGQVHGGSVAGYREEKGVSPKSIIPTFAAMKLLIDNWRWRGVPFYLRSGKRLSGRKTEIAVFFKPVPHLMFKGLMEGPITPNILALRIQPEEGISLSLQTKLPGSKVCLTQVSMDFSYPVEIQLDAYEWVLLDCMRKDQMLFVKEDGVEAAWALLTPVIERLESTTSAERFPDYAAGSSGPGAAALLIERDGRAWRPL